MGRSDYYPERGGIRHGAEPFTHWSEVTVQHVLRTYPFLFWVLMALLGYYVFFSHPLPPVEILSAEVSPQIVQAGAPVQVKFVLNRNQICPNSIISYWESEENDPTPIKLAPRTRTIPQIGKNLTVFVPDLRAPFELGRQCYRSNVVHRCPSGDVVVSTPQVCIQVVQ
jgi:hypothetical protein